jgi:hypothetical protein
MAWISGPALTQQEQSFFFVCGVAKLSTDAFECMDYFRLGVDIKFYVTTSAVSDRQMALRSDMLLVFCFKLINIYHEFQLFGASKFNRLAYQTVFAELQLYMRLISLCATVCDLGLGQTIE